jgi:hypothetical protein
MAEERPMERGRRLEQVPPPNPKVRERGELLSLTTNEIKKIINSIRGQN